MLVSLPAGAIKRYGYEAGDEYKFVIETRSTAHTEEGTSTTTSSYETVIKIDDIEEDTEGYSIKIDCIVVGAGYWFGWYGPGGTLINEQTMEGDAFITNGVGASLPTSIFTTTDWDDRGEEWDEFIDDIDDMEDYKVTDSSAKGGTFTADIEMDVPEENSNIDYDGDEYEDEYTGTMSYRIEYDSDGVLASSSTKSEIEFNRQNSLTSEYKIHRAGFEWSGVLPYILMAITGIVGLVAGFAIGFYKAKGRKPAAPPPTAPEA